MTEWEAEGAARRARVAWAFFDWANQPYFTVVTTFIFAPYFASLFVGDPVRGQAIWGYTQSAAGVVIALFSPVLGAIADAGGRRKPFLFVFQALCAAGCAALWLAVPGDPARILPVALALVVAAIGAEFSIAFNNALLPGLVPAHRMGRLSGSAWALGYAGGIIALVAVLIVSRPELIGITPPPGQALFGLDRASGVPERLTGPMSALWLVVFVLPMFLYTPDRGGPRVPAGVAMTRGLRQLGQTLRGLKDDRNLLLFLVAFMIYNDGLLGLIQFGGIYAAGAFGWGTTELGIFGILLTVLAMVGAWAGGRLDDGMGSRPTVLIAIAGAILGTIGILSTTAERILFVLPVLPRAVGAPLFASAAEQAFLGFAVLIGLTMGPMQAASRTLLGRLAPRERTAEYYGLFSLSGRATAFTAPFLIATATTLAQSQRAGAAVVVAFLAVGGALLLRVVEPRPGRAVPTR